MIDLTFNQPGRFWRGNLHTHSDRSDGALSPEETAHRYREAGYDFLASPIISGPSTDFL